MHGEGSTSEARNSCPQPCERLRADYDNTSNSQGLRNASQFGGASFFEIVECAVCQSVELAATSIVLELRVPAFRIERFEPSTKLPEILLGKVCHRLFYFFNLRHAIIILRKRNSASPFFMFWSERLGSAARRVRREQRRYRVNQNACEDVEIAQDSPVGCTVVRQLL